MRKIRLDLNEVQVESYPTETAANAERGTVKGMSGAADCTFDCYSATDPLECPCERQFTNEYEC